jgi:hypothetical protein
LLALLEAHPILHVSRIRVKKGAAICGHNRSHETRPTLLGSLTETKIKLSSLTIHFLHFQLLSDHGVRGTWREGSFTGDPKDMISKALEMGVCFHRGPALGEHGGTLLS